MNRVRLHKILINIGIVAVSTMLLPFPAGLIIGFLLVFGFNLYLNGKTQGRSAAPPQKPKGDIWQRNAQRRGTRPQAGNTEMTPRQQKLMTRAFPWIISLAICITGTVASYFGLGWIAMFFLFIVAFFVVAVYSIHKVETN